MSSQASCLPRRPKTTKLKPAPKGKGKTNPQRKLSDDEALRVFQALEPYTVAVHNFSDRNSARIVTITDIKAVFETIGKVLHVEIWFTHNNGAWAFVTYASKDHVRTAIEELNDQLIDMELGEDRIQWTRKLYVKEPQLRALTKNYTVSDAFRVLGQLGEDIALSPSQGGCSTPTDFEPVTPPRPPHLALHSVSTTRSTAKTVSYDDPDDPWGIGDSQSDSSPDSGPEPSSPATPLDTGPSLATSPFVVQPSTPLNEISSLHLDLNATPASPSFDPERAALEEKVRQAERKRKRLEYEKDQDAKRYKSEIDHLRDELAEKMKLLRQKERKGAARREAQLQAEHQEEIRSLEGRLSGPRPKKGGSDNRQWKEKPRRPPVKRVPSSDVQIVPIFIGSVPPAFGAYVQHQFQQQYHGMIPSHAPGSCYPKCAQCRGDQLEPPHIPYPPSSSSQHPSQIQHPRQYPSYPQYPAFTQWQWPPY